MQRLEVSGAVRLIYKSLGVKGLINLLTYLLTYLLTAWRRVLLEKLTGLQLVK